MISSKSMEDDWNGLWYNLNPWHIGRSVGSNMEEKVFECIMFWTWHPKHIHKAKSNEVEGRRVRNWSDWYNRVYITVIHIEVLLKIHYMSGKWGFLPTLAISFSWHATVSEQEVNYKETLGTTTTTNPHSSDEVLRFKLITKSTHMKTPCADKKIWPTWSVSRFKFRCYLAANDKVQMWNIQSAGDH